jgi:hypothetical protein
VEQSLLHVLEPTFSANGAEVGGVRERALGSPTHPLAQRGAWRRRAGRGSSAPPLVITDYWLLGYWLLAIQRHVAFVYVKWAPCTYKLYKLYTIYMIYYINDV